MPTVDIYSKQQVDALIAGAGGLPDPASASAGDVLTLDSNKDPAWVAPSGGGDNWEEIDLSNMPTDFSAGDRIRILTPVNCYLPNDPATWGTAISSSITLSNNGHSIVEFDIPSGSSTTTCLELVSVYNPLTVYIGLVTISSIEPIAKWNDPSKAIFTFQGIAFNGAGMKKASTIVYHSNVTSYVSKMWRMKA